MSEAKTFEEEWEAARAIIRQELQRFCRTEGFPTREQLIDSVREVFPRMGWSMMRFGHHSEWADYMDALLDCEAPPYRLGTPTELDASYPNTTWHRYIACAAALGWVDALWALEPAPWPLRTSAYPGVPLEVVSVRKPEGWPRARAK